MNEQQISLVSQFGKIVNEDILGKEPNDPIVKAISNFIVLTISQLKSKLIEKGKQTNSGALVQSIQPTEFEFNDGVFSMAILMEDYWKYVDGGVNGLKRNVGAPNWSSMEDYKAGTFQEFNKSIKGWIKDRGITELSWNGPDGVVTKRLETEKDFDSAAYVFMRGIRNNGIDPTHFVDEVLTEDALEDFENTLFELWQ